jgi:hypothetical protein
MISEGDLLLGDEADAVAMSVVSTKRGSVTGIVPIASLPHSSNAYDDASLLVAQANSLAQAIDRNLLGDVNRKVRAEVAEAIEAQMEHELRTFTQSEKWRFERKRAAYKKALATIKQWVTAEVGSVNHGYRVLNENW